MSILSSAFSSHVREHPLPADADPAPLDRARLQPDEYRSICAVCHTVTVHRVVNVAGKLTVICTECESK